MFTQKKKSLRSLKRSLKQKQKKKSLRRRSLKRSLKQKQKKKSLRRSSLKQIKRSKKQNRKVLIKLDGVFEEEKKGVEKGVEKDENKIYTNQKFRYMKDKLIPGLFATEKIEAEEIIICEQPLFFYTKTDSKYSNYFKRILDEQYPKLNDRIKSLWNELYSNLEHLKKITTGMEKIEEDERIIKFNSNSFDIKDYKILYYIISRINHNFTPNTRLILPKNPDEFAILYSLRIINPGEEITISYNDPIFDDNISDLNITHNIPTDQLGFASSLIQIELEKMFSSQEWYNDFVSASELIRSCRSFRIKSPSINTISLSLAFQSKNEKVRKLLFEFLYDKIKDQIEKNDIYWYRNIFDDRARGLLSDEVIEDGIQLIKTTGEEGNEDMLEFYTMIDEAKKRIDRLRDECSKKPKLDLKNISDIVEIKLQIFPYPEHITGDEIKQIRLNLSALFENYKKDKSESNKNSLINFFNKFQSLENIATGSSGKKEFTKLVGKINDYFGDKTPLSETDIKT